MLTTLLATTAFGLVMHAPTPMLQGSPDSLKLERTYKAGEHSVYSLEVNGQPMGKQAFEISTTVLKLIDTGANIELSAADKEHASEGQTPGKFTSDFSKFAMPASLELHDNNWMYVLHSIVSYVPANTIDKGKEFKINWNSTDQGVTVSGTGTLEGIEDKDGKKVANVKTNLEVTPSGSSPATVKNKASFDSATGKLISAEGTVEISTEGTLNYKIKLVKES